MRARRTRRAWELGGGVGASTIWLAAGLRRPGGHLTVIERDAARHKRARGHLARAGLADRIDLRLGETGRLQRHLPGSPSLVLLDHDLFDRADDLMAILPRCAPGALVVAHGMHFDVGDHARYRALVATQPEIASEVTLAVGRGLSLTLLHDS
jgi:predicted O-methyltransferase YrrM